MVFVIDHELLEPLKCMWLSNNVKNNIQKKYIHIKISLSQR